MPDNWQQLVINSREKSTDGFFDVTKTWLTEEEDVSADSTNNQAIGSGTNLADDNRNNSLEVENLLSSDSERPTTPTIDSGSGTTSDLESEMDSSDDVVINEHVEDPPDNSPDDEPVDASSEYTSTFDSEMPPILNLQTAGFSRSP